MSQKTLQRSRTRSGRQQATFQIPVVVHVIHNGENIGSGTNIPDEQILSQLSVLNKDYNRQNTDAGNTPSEFVPLAGSFNIEFVLAKQDPEGLSTTGIVRTRGTKTSWTMNDNYQLKALSYWPAEDYLNIWVCRLTDFLGYAQFPVSALPGLENSSTNRLTDGVVISYNAFGSAEDGNFTLQNAYNRGRTATHEIGHFFGLNHIWGDDDNACTGTDFVDDTPNQSGSSSGCPSHPRVTCENTSMFQNYLDYTNDACMNLFTVGQVARMDIVLANSPRRASLTTSRGLNDPAPIANDLGVKDIIRPSAGECAVAFSPQIEVRNYGSDVITSARIRLRKDGAIVETRDFEFSPALGVLESRILSFSTLSYTSGTHNASVEILLTNGVADGQPANNTLSRTFNVPQSIALPFVETLNVLPASWSIQNPDDELTWTLSSTGTGSALGINLYDYEDHVGEIDAFVSPTFDLTSAPAALLKFDVAHAQFNASTDGLQVLLFTNCNTNLEDGLVIYNKSGGSLATTQPTAESFEPAADQWRTEVVDLTPYIGQANVQVAFVSLNDWGNNIYLDNISITTDPIADVVAVDLLEPSPVTCYNEVHPVIRVSNAGTLITEMTVTMKLNSQTVTQTISDLQFAGNTSRDITLDAITLVNGENNIEITLSSPNGTPDFFPENNTLNRSIIYDNSTETLPLRQRFDDNTLGTWNSNNPTGGREWQLISVNNNPAVYVNAFTNNTGGDRSWLVSSTLDFTGIEDGLLKYDHSYASRAGGSDVLYILASRDCGSTFTDTLLRAGPNALARGRTSNSSWSPTQESDWTHNAVSLASLANATDVRIAFVFVNGRGNNLYLDNIEFFLSGNPLAITGTMAVYPTVLDDEPLSITFNLPEKDDVNVDLIDAMGRVLNSYKLPGVLNQTYTLDMPYHVGWYYLRASTRSGKYLGRFMIR